MAKQGLQDTHWHTCGGSDGGHRVTEAVDGRLYSTAPEMGLEGPGEPTGVTTLATRAGENVGALAARQEGLCQLEDVGLRH